MKELYIKILRDVKINQLLLSQDAETVNHLVFLRDPYNSAVIYSINFNGGELILGLDSNRRINSLELNRPRKDWTIIDDKHLKPFISDEGCLEFTNINSRHNELDLPLIIQTDKLYSGIKINMGNDKHPSSFWVAIANQCSVEIADNYLRGFWINFRPLEPKVE